MPSWGEVRLDPLLNDWAADQAATNHSHVSWRSGVIMRICDAAKHASVDLSPAICSLAALAQVFFKRRLWNSPLNFFTYQGQGKGYYLDRGLNVIIITNAKNGHHQLRNKHIPVCIKKMCRNSLSCGEAVPREKKCTDAFTLCLTFSVAASILDRCLSAPLRLTRWQVWVIKFEHCWTLLHHETLWLGPQCQWRLEWAHKSIFSPPLSSPPVWPTDWAHMLCTLYGVAS